MSEFLASGHGMALVLILGVILGVVFAFLQIEYQGSAIAWYPIQNIKAMIAVSEEEVE